MASAWDLGLCHFQKGNFYAARDLWQLEAEEATVGRESARAANGLGAVYERIRSASEARAHFERAVEISQKTVVEPALRVKHRANLTSILCSLDYIDAAIKMGQETCAWLNTGYALESVFALNAYLLSLTRGEVYKEVLQLAPLCLDMTNRLTSEQGREFYSAVFNHNFGYAANALGRYTESLRYYQTALTDFGTPETLQELSRFHLLRGDVKQAIEYAYELYDAVWKFEAMNEKAELAHCLVLTGLLAYYANHRDLYRRCIEKAELYFGHVSLWSAWIKMRDIEADLSERHITVEPGMMDFSRWSTFLDDLNLMDGLQLMFPQLYRLGRYSSTFAERLALRLDLDVNKEHLRHLQVAGRLSYLGMTVMCADAGEARRTLCTESGRIEMAELGCRLLEAYPHAEGYRTMINHCRRPHYGSHIPAPYDLFTQCLGIALDYVEAIEIHGMTHCQAVDRVLVEQNAKYDARVLQVFATESSLEE